MTSTLFLGVIAVAVLTMAVIQVGAIIYAMRLARRVDRLMDEIDRDLKPLFASLTALIHDAARAASLAAGQVERVDRLFSDVTQRVEQTMAVVQRAVVGPARQGFAMVSAVRAVLGALSELRTRSRAGRAEEEEALFIG